MQLNTLRIIEQKKISYFSSMNMKKSYLPIIYLSFLALFITGIVSNSLQTGNHTFNRPENNQNKSEVFTPQFVSEQGILVSPIKVTESNAVNYQNYKQNHFVVLHSCKSQLQSQISQIRSSAERGNTLFSVPIYITLHRLII